MLQSERVTTPTGKGRADKYRYPKGHPKAGQYAPKSLAEAQGATRYVRRRSGKREAITATGKGRGKQVRTVDIGRSFTEATPAWAVTEAAIEADQKGRSMFVKVGGKVYRVPADRMKDAAAWMTDLGARLRVAGRTKRRPSPPMVALELSYGAHGILVNLDGLQYFDPELTEELGPVTGEEDITSDLSGYIARTAADYIGIKVNPDDIAEQWEEQPGDDEDED